MTNVLSFYRIYKLDRDEDGFTVETIVGSNNDEACALDMARRLSAEGTSTMVTVVEPFRDMDGTLAEDEEVIAGFRNGALTQ